MPRPQWNKWTQLARSSVIHAGTLRPPISSGRGKTRSTYAFAAAALILYPAMARNVAWEETWRSLESVESFDLDLVVEYVTLLGNRTTAAKVGFYLQRHAEALMVEDRHLHPLRHLRPAQPHYLERGKPGKLVGDWNLVVPPFLDGAMWEEPR